MQVEHDHGPVPIGSIQAAACGADLAGLDGNSPRPVWRLAEGRSDQVFSLCDGSHKLPAVPMAIVPVTIVIVPVIVIVPMAIVATVTVPMVVVVMAVPNLLNRIAGHYLGLNDDRRRRSSLRRNAQHRSKCDKRSNYIFNHFLNLCYTPPSSALAVLTDEGD